MHGYSRGFAAILALAASALLAACATPHGARVAAGSSVERYVLDARFGLRENGSSYSGRLNWRHDARGDAVLVQDPFGSGVAELFASPAGARMRLADGRTAEAADASVLMRDLTGIALPVSDLARWLTAREVGPNAGPKAGPNAVPEGAAASGDERDGFGRVVRMTRKGWQLEYRYDDDTRDALPSRVVAANGGGIELRLAIEAWGTGGAP